MEVAHELDERQECTAEFAQEKIFFPPDIHTLCNSSSFAWLEKNGGAALIIPPHPQTHTQSYPNISLARIVSLRLQTCGPERCRRGKPPSLLFFVPRFKTFSPCASRVIYSWVPGLYLPPLPSPSHSWAELENAPFPLSGVVGVGSCLAENYTCSVLCVVVVMF